MKFVNFNTYFLDTDFLVGNTLITVKSLSDVLDSILFNVESL